MINLSTFIFNRRSKLLLCHGSSFTVKQHANSSCLKLDLLKFCRNIRLKKYFEAHTFQDNNDTKYCMKKSNPSFTPSNFNNTFEEQINILESYTVPITHPSDTIQKNTLDYLKKQRTLKFCHADKGGSMIILNKEDYKNLVYKHLSDNSTYKQLNICPNEQVRRKIRSLINTYKNSFSKTEIECLNNFDIRTSKFYVLPKVHKSTVIKRHCQTINDKFIDIQHLPNDLPSRPIVSNVNSPTSGLSHMVDKILQPFVDKVPGYVKDTFHFLENLPRHFEKPVSFISCDVCSLYTIIPKDFGLQSVQFWLTKFPSSLNSKFSKNFVISAIDLILSNNTFYYDEVHYLQINGTAMGTKMAPKYAHLVMGYLEEMFKDQCKEIFGERVTTLFFDHYFRYLDDIFIITTLEKSTIDCILSKLNTFHSAFKFTHEISDSKLHFLDVLIINNNGFIETDIYSKPTDSYNYLHFYSHHPRHTKRNIPYCLAQRINKIVSCSTTKNFRFLTLKNRLLSLKYPSQLIDDAITKAKSCSKTQSSQHLSNTVFLSIPYTSASVEICNKIALPFIQHLNEFSFFQTQINFVKCFRQQHNLLTYLNTPTHFSTKPCKKPRCKSCSSILSQKHNVTFNNKTLFFNANMDCTTNNVIYVLICARCQELYVGQTTLQLNLRMNLHRQQMTQTKYCSLKVSFHLKNCGEGFYFVPIFKVNFSSLYILTHMENYFIQILKPSLNSLNI